MSRTTVHFDIQELVLHGYARADRYRIGEALERELARLVEQQGVPPGLSGDADIARIDAGAIPAASSAPEAVGAEVARAVYGGLQA